jgi:hypothetical protein
MRKPNLQSATEILYLADADKEHLLVKVPGRGWFLSSGGNDTPGLTLRRLNRWLADDRESFRRVTVQHFHGAKR